MIVLCDRVDDKSFHHKCACLITSGSRSSWMCSSDNDWISPLIIFFSQCALRFAWPPLSPCARPQNREPTWTRYRSKENAQTIDGDDAWLTKLTDISIAEHRRSSMHKSTRINQSHISSIHAPRCILNWFISPTTSNTYHYAFMPTYKCIYALIFTCVMYSLSFNVLLKSTRQ